MSKEFLIGDTLVNVTSREISKDANTCIAVECIDHNNNHRGFFSEEGSAEELIDKMGQSLLKEYEASQPNKGDNQDV